jgi:antitoxin (DNA-binding transcriptional repressor) of toxin-antitoxin stability system
MKTMSVLEIDQHWPEAREALKADSGILVTRDGKAIGRLIPIEPEEDTRPRFDPEKNRLRRKKLWGDETFDSLTPLMESREERVIISESALAAMAAEADESAQEAESRKLAGEKLSKWREETFGGRKFDTLTSLMADRDERFER